MKQYPKVTRVELIVNGTRHFVTWSANNVAIDEQDNKRTLKIFLKRIEV